jgi:hypothetical protein
VSRLLVDIDRLCNVHLPRWFATPGMEGRKIARFYEDPAPVVRHRRSISVETTLRWEARRRQHYLRRRLLGWIRRFKRKPPSESSIARLKTPS